MKPTSSKYVVHRSSSLSYNMKKNISVADLFRSLKSHITFVRTLKRTISCTRLMHRIPFLDYNQKDRIRGHKTARKEFEEIVNRDADATQSESYSQIMGNNLPADMKKTER